MPLRDLRRRVGQKQRRQSLLVVCQGEETERLYLRALKRDFHLANVEVAIISTSRDPRTAVDIAVKRKSQDRFDEAWCVLDHEFAPHNKSFQPAVEAARRHKINLAVSNPSFEFWILLHFSFTAGGFYDNKELLREVQAKYPQYEKNRDCYGELKDKQATAIAHARRLRESHGTGEVFPHPSTDVDLLIERFSSQLDFRG